MATISYNAVLPQNLALKRLPLKQIEVILDISGAEADPLTLQQIRDEDSIRQCFLARRNNINQLIQEAAHALQSITDDKKGAALVDEFNRRLTTQVNALQHELQERCNAFVQKQKKQVNDLFWAQCRMVVRVVWALAKYVKSGLEVPVKAGAAIAAGVTPVGVFLSAVAIKSLIGTVSEFNKANEELDSALDDERTQFGKLKNAVKELKKIKKPETVPQAKIDAVSVLMGPYGARLLGVDTAAKKSAVKLDLLLKGLEKGKMRNAKKQKEIEDKIDATIKKIIKLSEDVTEGRKMLQAAKDKIAEASKRVQKPGFWEWAGSGLWTAVDKLMGAGESLMEDTAEKAVESYLQSRLEEELDEAVTTAARD